jgi:hypothetical protein
MLVSGVDLAISEKGLWPQAQAAREWFAIHGPADAPPLPLTYAEREDLKRGGVTHLIAWYARSLADQDYDVKKHPSFFDYACGVMASQHAPWFIKKDQALHRRFPARSLPGLTPNLDWEPVKKKRRRRGTQ